MNRTAMTGAEELGLVAADQVADLVRSTARNRSAAAYNLRRAGKVFTVPTSDGDRYPGFQFDTGTGKPHPVVAQVLTTLAPLRLGGWELLAWFTAATGWLGDRRPADVLVTDPAAVVTAAAPEAGDIGF